MTCVPAKMVWRLWTSGLYGSSEAASRWGTADLVTGTDSPEIQYYENISKKYDILNSEIACRSGVTFWW